MRKPDVLVTLWIAALVTLSRSALAADAGAATGAPTPKCNLLQYASLDMTTEPTGRVTVSAKVNGRTVPFIVDTGGAFGGISNSFATAMKLPLRHWPFGTRVVFYGKGEEKHMVGLDTFGLGRLIAKSVPMPVMPDTLLQSEAYGLLGGNVLHGYDVEVDFFHEKLNLFSPDHCPERVVYWADAWAQVPITLDDSWHILIPVTLDGKAMKATVDTGAADTIMTIEHAQDLFGWDLSALKPVAGGRYAYPFASLKFEGVEVRHPNIRLVPKSAVAVGAPELLLGVNVLRELHLYISYKEKMLYLTSAEAQSAN
jgi:predicted aspartyl protease